MRPQKSNIICTVCWQDDVTASKKAAAYSSSEEEAAKSHWSAILFVTRKMTAVGLDALFKQAACLKAWRAATLVGYGGSMASSCLSSKVSYKWSLKPPNDALTPQTLTYADNLLLVPPA